jgi:hypothetical protein
LMDTYRTSVTQVEALHPRLELYGIKSLSGQEYHIISSNK